VLAVVTQDPQRQQLAAALIEHLLAQRTVSLDSGCRPAATATPLRCLGFGRCLSALHPQSADPGQAAPNPDLTAAVAGPLTQALADVLSGEATPVGCPIRG